VERRVRSGRPAKRDEDRIARRDADRWREAMSEARLQAGQKSAWKVVLALVLATLIRTASRLVNAYRLLSRAEHRRRVRGSRRVLTRLHGFTGEPGTFGRCIAYLRKVDPLVFEEVVLSALEDAGLFVLRNRRYTGDGGVDGVVWMQGTGWVALQVKRYREHIDNQDVRAFGEVVARMGLRLGMFVHTGRTGAACYSTLRTCSVQVVSGTRLVDLILERRVPMRGRP
jgi:restriction system protein